jgi:phage terminase large subunit-like protein
MWTPSDWPDEGFGLSFESLFAAWMNLPDEQKPLFPLTLPEKMLERWRKLWGAFSLPHQREPRLGQGGAPWTTWLILGGRGAGKTRAGAEWVRAQANDPAARIALIGETGRDVREVMIEGVSGLLSVHEHGARPTWEPSRGLVTFESGAVAQCFSAEDPDSLRGPQFSAAWCDELAKWRHAEATFDMLQFGLRLGTRPRQVITTTPRPIALLKRLIADPRSLDPLQITPPSG